MKFTDYYKLLGITISATSAEITSAYKAKARLCHPDLNDDPDATKQMQLLNEARDTLSDPQKRSAYDKQWLKNFAQRFAKKAPRRQPVSSNPPETTVPAKWASWTDEPTKPAPKKTRSGGSVLMGLGLAALAGYAYSKSGNQWDSNADRYRARNGQFRSGKFS